MRKSLGILGGMGPLASAEFLKTLYEFNLRDKEQSAPACFLFSDPSIPDRTEAILKNDTDEVLQRITEGLEKLENQGANCFVIACISSHIFIPQLPERFRRTIISLVEIALREVKQFPGKCLLLATTGTVRSRSFQRSPQWHEMQNKFLIPDNEDQKRVHNFIYKHIKPNRDIADETLFGYLKDKYQVDAFVAGCTEFHLANKKLLAAGNPDLRFIDPLYTIGRELPQLLQRARLTV